MTTRKARRPACVKGGSYMTYLVECDGKRHVGMHARIDDWYLRLSSGECLRLSRWLARAAAWAKEEK
jgi:hypothetical protein